MHSRFSSRLLVAAALAGVSVVLSAAPAGAAGTVTPTLECVFQNADGTDTAVFGYSNTTGAVVSLPVGATNGFSSAPDDRGQPTVFATGQHDHVVLATFAKGNLSWNLDGNSAKATNGSTKCVSDPSLPVSQGSPAGLALTVIGSAVVSLFLGRRRIRPLRPRR